ncbi:hypothetical protein ACFL4Y_03390 [Gemmatimonadota bacterium]
MTLVPASWLVVGMSVALLAGCGGEPSAEDLLEKSRAMPDLYAFGALYVPLYQQAMADSNWAPIRAQISELVRIKQRINALDVPDAIRMKRNDWESYQRLFTRAVDNLAVVVTWDEERIQENLTEVVEGVQRAYDWWQMLVEMLP